jgi:hypothetical protein
VVVDGFNQSRTQTQKEDEAVAREQKRITAAIMKIDVNAIEQHKKSLVPIGETWYVLVSQ